MSSTTNVVEAAPWIHAVGGSVGTALATLLLYPLERLRIEMQAQLAANNVDGEGSALDDILFEGENEEEEDNQGSLDGSSSSWTDATLPPPPHDTVLIHDDQEEKDPPLIEEDHGSVSDNIIVWVDTPSVPPENSEKTREVLPQSTNCNITSSWNASWKDICQRGELYRGLGPIIATLSTSNFIYFYFHQLFKAISVPSFMSSTMAGIANVLLTNPLWVTNLRIVAGHTPTQSLWKECIRIAQQEHISTLWKGTASSIMLVSNPVIHFYFYEHMKQAVILRKRKTSSTARSLTAMEAFVLGAIAKVIATTLTYPLQLTQTVLRLQQDQQKSSSQPSDGRLEPSRGSILSTLRLIVRKKGLSGLYTFYRLKLLHTVLTAAFTFLTYEKIVEVVGKVHLHFKIIQSVRKNC